MPGKRSNTRLGRVLGVLAAGLAAVLFVLERTTDLPVPYGYDGDAFLLGAGVAVVAVVLVGWGIVGGSR